MIFNYSSVYHSVRQMEKRDKAEFNVEDFEGEGTRHVILAFDRNWTNSNVKILKTVSAKILNLVIKWNKLPRYKGK